MPPMTPVYVWRSCFSWKMSKTVVKSDVPWWLWGLGALIISKRLYEKVHTGTLASAGFTCSRQLKEQNLSMELNPSHGTYLAPFTWPHLFGKGFWGCKERERGGFPLAFSPVNKVLLLAKVFSCFYESKWGPRVSNQHTKSLYSLQRQLFPGGFWQWGGGGRINQVAL